MFFCHTSYSIAYITEVGTTGRMQCWVLQTMGLLTSGNMNKPWNGAAPTRPSTCLHTCDSQCHLDCMVMKSLTKPRAKY